MFNSTLKESVRYPFYIIVYRKRDHYTNYSLVWGYPFYIVVYRKRDHYISYSLVWGSLRLAPIRFIIQNTEVYECQKYKNTSVHNYKSYCNLSLIKIASLKTVITCTAHTCMHTHTHTHTRTHTHARTHAHTHTHTLIKSSQIFSEYFYVPKSF